MPLRVLGADGIALNVNTATAIDYAVDHGAAVVNASIYGERSPQVLRDAVARARAAGVLVVAAAGNEANTTPEFPAAFPETISVASATPAGERAPFTSYGDWVKFAAPDCAPITTLGGGSGVGCATSVSTPLVAGVVGLLRSRAPFATADDLERALATSARPVSGTRYGLVDAAAALARLGQPAPTLHPVVLGEPVVGEQLEGFSGLWSGAGVDVRYRWERCRDTCAGIPSAAARYTARGRGRRLHDPARPRGARPRGRGLPGDEGGRGAARAHRTPLHRRTRARRRAPRRPRRLLGGDESPLHDHLGALPPRLLARRNGSDISRASP